MEKVRNSPRISAPRSTADCSVMGAMDCGLPSPIVNIFSVRSTLWKAAREDPVSSDGQQKRRRRTLGDGKADVVAEEGGAFGLALEGVHEGLADLAQGQEAELEHREGARHHPALSASHLH